MFKKNFIAFYLFLTTTFVLAQPYWVINKSVENHAQYYFGIGYSSISELKADEQAFINFGKMIELKVHSTTELLLEENNLEISNKTVNSTKIESSVKLKGITITERFYDKENKQFFSLIKYTIAEYEDILKRELNSEIAIIKEKNKNEEAKREENFRHIEEISKLAETEAISRIEKEKREDNIKAAEEEQRLKHERFMLNHYKLFYEKPVSPYLITTQNAEVGVKPHEFVLKPTVVPLNFVQANYHFYTDYLGFSVGFYWRNNKVEQQDFQIKLRILKENFGIYPIALAVGIVQYSNAISNFSNFDNIEWGVSPSFMFNISFPQIYSTTSFTLDRRKTSLGFRYFPFFNYLNGKVSLILQSDFIFMNEYKDRFGNRVILQPGLNFEVIPNSLFIMLSYEDNEFATITLDFKL